MPTRVKILSVDDSMTVRRQIKKVFQDYYIEFIEAENGEVGLEAARENPDLILLDITMPVMDGYTMLKKLRNDPYISYTPVITISADLNKETMIKMAASGSNDYIPKPFKADDVLRKAKGLLRKTLVTQDERINEIKETEQEEVFYNKGDHLTVNIPNLEPDVIMNIAKDFPVKLEEAVKNKADNVFINLEKLNNIDVVSMTCLNGVISAADVRGIKCYIFASDGLIKQMDIYPGSEGWNIYGKREASKSKGKMKELL